MLPAVIGELLADYQLHNEERAARFGSARIQNARDIGMVHHGQCLALDLKPRDHRAGIHAVLEHF